MLPAIFVGGLLLVAVAIWGLVAASRRPCAGPVGLAAAVAGAVGLCVAVFGVTAGVATAARAETVDLTPLVRAGLDYLLPVALAVVVPVGGRAVQRGLQLLGLAIDARQRAVVDEVLQKAVMFAHNTVSRRAQPATVDVRSEALAAAVDYAARSAPAALRHFGVGPDRLAEMVRARMTLVGD